MTAKNEAVVAQYESVRDLNHTRQILLDAGADVFAEKGLAGTRIDDLVVRSGGVNRSMIYYIFSSKHGLYQAVLRHILEQSRERMLELLMPRLQSSDRVGDGRLLLTVINTLHDIYVRNPQWARLLLRETLDGGADLRAVIESIPDFWLTKQAAVKLLERGRDEFGLPIGDPHSFVFLIQMLTMFPPVAAPVLDVILPPDEDDHDMLQPENWKSFMAQFVSLFMTPARKAPEEA